MPSVTDPEESIACQEKVTNTTSLAPTSARSSAFASETAPGDSSRTLFRQPLSSRSSEDVGNKNLDSPSPREECFLVFRTYSEPGRKTQSAGISSSISASTADTHCSSSMKATESLPSLAMESSASAANTGTLGVIPVIQCDNPASERGDSREAIGSDHHHRFTQSDISHIPVSDSHLKDPTSSIGLECRTSTDPKASSAETADMDNDPEGRQGNSAPSSSDKGHSSRKPTRPRGERRSSRQQYPIGGYSAPVMPARDSPGPVDLLECVLKQIGVGKLESGGADGSPENASPKRRTAGSSDDVSLRRLVWEFREGLPRHARAQVWKILLGLDRRKGRAASLLQFLSARQLDEPNQRVIRSDVERTRAQMEFFQQESSRNELEALLTFYCKVKSIKYKQGLNEVLAPIYYLKHTSGLHVTDAFAIFYAFVSRYLPLYQDEDFTTLQCAFHLFNRLLMYHDPALAVFLEENGVSSELYVTPWFLTAFASKTQIDHLLCLWDYYIVEDDRFFYCFIALALLTLYRELLFETEVSQIPETLTRITIHSFEDIHRLWQLAKELKVATPFSFAYRMSHCQVSKTAHLRHLEAESAFYILPQEVVRHAYGLVGSPNNTRPWKLLILDLRSKWHVIAGRLPPSLHVNRQSDWKSLIRSLLIEEEDEPKESEVAPEQEGSNSSGSQRLNAESPGSAYYFPNGGFGTGVLLPHRKPSKTLPKQSSAHHVCLMASDENKQDAMVLDEIYCILVREMKLRWISIVKGGYSECHRLAQQSGLEIVDHNSILCPVCNPGAKPSQTLNRYNPPPSLPVPQGNHLDPGEIAITQNGGSSNTGIFSFFKRGTRRHTTGEKAAADRRSNCEDDAGLLMPSAREISQRFQISSSPTSRKMEPAETSIIGSAQKGVIVGGPLLFEKMEYHSLVNKDGVKIFQCLIDEIRYVHQSHCPDANKVLLVVSMTMVAVVSSPDLSEEQNPVTVHVYIKHDLQLIQKITSRKTDSSLLCFYFWKCPREDRNISLSHASKKRTPDMSLRFDTEEDAHECINYVRNIYKDVRSLIKQQKPPRGKVE